MFNHGNSQKRIYLDGEIYFLIGITGHQAQYVEKPIFWEMFLENLRMPQRLKDFKLYGWFLPAWMICSDGAYDHFYMLIKPNGEWNYSQVMFSIKKQFHHTFLQKYPYSHNIFHSKFKWQKSFHDHVVSDKQDFFNHLNSVRINPIKHDPPENWHYRWIDQGWENIDPP